GERGQGSDKCAGEFVGAAVESAADHRVEDMRVYPLISIGHASAANGRLGEPSIRHVVLPPVGVEQAQTTGGHAFPAGVIELTSEVPRAFECFGRHVTPS